MPASPVSIRLGAVCALTLAAHACTLLTGADSRDEPALIVFYGDTARIQAPDSVERGVPFEVRVGTFGGGCTREIARTGLRVAGAVAEIRPFNRTTGAEVCTSDLLFLEHRVRVRFDAPGTATLRVIGEQRGAAAGGRNAPARLEREVIVR